ncbi:hypothetical protein DL95DRAFT_418332 [Leptodontidium sp. 2 PMI_412]|nr:hypothetical protein DL95DRAFT_418332 [Leptodontidium sp. 2 PMI_412]
MKVHFLQAESSRFRQALHRSIRKESLRRLQEVETKEDLMHLIRQEQERAEKLATDAVETASAQQNEVDENRQHGFKKVTTVLQATLTTFSEFAQCYAGFVEMIKLADKFYGGLAYGTLSVFLIIVVNKSEHEKRIRESLKDFQREMSRVARLGKLAPTEEMVALLASVYAKVIDFARKATLYYQKLSIGRLLFVILHPPKFYIDRLRDGIVHDTHELYREMSVIQATWIQYTAEVTNNISKSQEYDRIRSNKQAVIDLFKPLGNLTVNPEEIRQYRGSLTDPVNIGKKYIQFDFEKFSNDEPFKSWKASAESGLLLLKGKTHNTRTGFSWLSIAALDLIDDVNRDHDSYLVYCLVSTSVWMENNSKARATIVISKIIRQLLERKPVIVQDPARYFHLRDRFSSESWQVSRKAPFDLLIELLTEFPKTYIILDRIDRCDYYHINFLDQLLRVIRECSTIVKIFVVLDENIGRGFDEKALDLSGVDDKIFVVTKDQDFRRHN